MSEFFSSINPDNNNKANDHVPELAENYWAPTVEGLMPGEIVHPHPYSAIAMDRETKRLYISGEAEFDAGSFAPGSYYGDRFGLMRVYQPDENGGVIDGLLIDIRSIGKGSIRSEDIIVEDDTDIMTSRFARFKDPKPITGSVYTDVEGNTAYQGDERLLAAAQYLAEQVDAAREKDTPKAILTSEKVALKSLENAAKHEPAKEILDVTDVTVKPEEPRKTRRSRWNFLRSEE